jgi:hypothetical protein
MQKVVRRPSLLLPPLHRRLFDRQGFDLKTVNAALATLR